MRRLLVSLAIFMIIVPAAYAAADSSCPAPCAKLPKSVISVRDAGFLDANGDAPALVGQLAAGKKHTILKIAGHIALDAGAGISGVWAMPIVNGVGNGYPVARVTCLAGSACTASGTWWLDIDAAEAESPGEFLKQPLTIGLFGGNTSVAGGGVYYGASFTAELVKKR